MQALKAVIDSWYHHHH